MTKAGGSGAAFDAGVSTAKAAPDSKAVADAAVAACRAKVERQRAHLAGAEKALAQAIAER
jgi:hypothetical protein